MKLKNLVLASLALGLAAVLVAPSPRASGFSTLGFSLGIAQRDFRVFNNFVDPSANDNKVADPSFPDYTGAVVAIWKACVEWGSQLHGNGQGDPHQAGSLGSGEANFDASFQGEATGVGGADDNIHSTIISCGGGGMLAFTEVPGNDGWRIRYCEEVVWKDGPGTNIGGGFDLQGVATHEYGHALGLGHSTVSGATMFPVASINAVIERSIDVDDRDGLQAIYGKKDATKPRIGGVAVDSNGVLSIGGENFTASGNEVRFTQKANGGNGNPIIVASVASTNGGKLIKVGVPATAGSGDVLVKIGGSSAFSSLSNAWPIDLVADPGTAGPKITSVTPASIQAVNPKGQSLSLKGSGFSATTGVSIDGVALTSFPPQFAVINDTTLAVNEVPLLQNFGDVTIEVTTLNGKTTATLAVNPNDPPVLDLSSSDPSFLFNFSGATLVMGSRPFDVFFLTVSPDLVPSFLPFLISLDIGNSFSTLLFLGNFSVNPIRAYTSITFPFPKPLPAGVKLHFQAGVLVLDGAPPKFPLKATNVETGTVLQ